MEQSLSAFLNIEGVDLHKLHQISQNKNYSIKIGNKKYFYHQEQLIFISLNAFYHYQSLSSIFEISMNQIPKYFHDTITIENLQSSFALLDSLFHSSTSFEINDSNASSLFALSKLLDNPHLHNRCEKYYQSHSQTFSFSFKQLKYLPQHDRKSLKDLDIHVNGEIFKTNRYLYSLLSNSYFKLNTFPTEITLSMQNEEILCFISFLNILEGISMNLLKFETDLLFSLFQTVECSSVLSYLSKQIKIPETIEESLQFLHFSFSNVLIEHHQ
jgi:hypothetical protein